MSDQDYIETPASRYAEARSDEDARRIFAERRRQLAIEKAIEELADGIDEQIGTGFIDAETFDTARLALDDARMGDETGIKRAAAALAKCESGWTGDRCTAPLFHEGEHTNETEPVRTNGEQWREDWNAGRTDRTLDPALDPRAPYEPECGNCGGALDAKHAGAPCLAGYPS